MLPAPERHEGEGPYSQLILRNVTVINGTGAPAFGPADVVIERNRIVQAMSVGAPGGVKQEPNRPKLAAGGREIDLRGHYVLPGLVDMHGHIGGEDQGVPAEYVYKLWMGHGITTDPRAGLRQRHRVVRERRASAAPRMRSPRRAFFRTPSSDPTSRSTTSRGRAALGARHEGEGRGRHEVLRLSAGILEAVFDELKKQGMRSACHHAQLDVRRVNVLTTARWGLTTHGTLVRPAGGAVRRPHRAGLSARLQLQQRAGSLRPGRPAVAAGGEARQREVRSSDEELLGRSTSRSIRRSRSISPRAI